MWTKNVNKNIITIETLIVKLNIKGQKRLNKVVLLLLTLKVNRLCLLA